MKTFICSKPERFSPFHVEAVIYVGFLQNHQTLVQMYSDQCKCKQSKQNTFTEIKCFGLDQSKFELKLH